ncbi:MAG: histidine kinase [Bacteroidales bacterium]|nr:histidine kinase [Bacteroidales bacterium]
MKRVGTSWIIHGFALLHAAVTVLCHWLNFPDSLLLTALTMTLTVIVCLRENLTVEITIASIVLVNIVGFLLGSLGAEILVQHLPDMVQHALSTFLVTELLGWSLYAFAHKFSPAGGAAGYEREQSWARHRWVLIGSIAFIFGVRVYMGLAFTGSLFQESGVITMLVVVTVIALTYMVSFAIRMQREASRQRTRRHQAEFRYMTLKHQVNPHFLFNSLNVLDSIVQDGTREEASAYIHKMAAIYRYLVQQEGERLVPVADELAFAHNYRELLQIRFPEGLVVQDNGVLANPPKGFMPPCTLQLLVENAIKHNSLSPDKPLVITCRADENSITISNNLNPKLSTRPSTGIGLQYIRNQYRDLVGAEITVKKTADSFTVTLPILH